MALYQYTAVAANGLESEGSIEANNEIEASKIIQERQLVPLQIEEYKETSTGLFSWWYVTATDRILLLRQLAMMTRAGITIPSALPEVARTAYKTKLRTALEQVLEDLQTGTQLSAAMRTHPRIFNEVVCGVIEAAEQTGELSPAFDRLALTLKFKQEVRNKLTMSFIYPTIVIIVTLLVTYGLFFHFIPKLSKFLLQLGKPLPAFTQHVFEFAAALRENILLIVIVASSIALVLFLVYKTLAGRRKLETYFSYIPVIGNILIYSEVSMISSTLRAMMESGSSLISSLPLVGNALSTQIYRDWVNEMKNSLMQGSPLESSMHTRLIPSAARSVIKTGEQSGSLPEAFEELENYYGNLLQHKINLLVALINPALIIIVGAIVAVVYIAIILAIVSVNG